MMYIQFIHDSVFLEQKNLLLSLRKVKVVCNLSTELSLCCIGFMVLPISKNHFRSVDNLSYTSLCNNSFFVQFAFRSFTPLYWCTIVARINHQINAFFLYRRWHLLYMGCQNNNLSLYLPLTILSHFYLLYKKMSKLAAQDSFLDLSDYGRPFENACESIKNTWFTPIHVTLLWHIWANSDLLYFVHIT
jgi:hypothetical protein